jgi:thermolysin
VKHSSWLILVVAFSLTFAASGSIQASAPPPPQSAVQAALSALKQVAGDSLNVEWSDGVGSMPTFVSGRIPAGKAAPEQAARQFFTQYGALYAIRDQAQELTLARVDRDDLDIQHVHFDQTVNGVSVFGGQMIAHLRGDEITTVNGKYFPNVSVDTSPRLTQAEALAGVLADIGDAEAKFNADHSGLVVYVEETQQPHLAWKVNAFSWKNLGNWLYFVDAVSGKVIHKLNQLDTVKVIKVYTANHQELTSAQLPGSFICQDSACTSASDTGAQYAYSNASKVYDYYKNIHNRLSYNGADSELRSTIRYGNNYENAFWTGSPLNQMVYGDGDTYVQAFDVVAHELTHGVTNYTDNLIYEHQPGALNESWSDVMAVFAGCSAQTGTADCTWTMGETLNGGAIRDISDPTLYGDPDHWSDYSWLPLEADNGGVHSNSGIPNKAAYLLTSGGTFHSVAVTGIGYTKTEQIYYRAMQHYLTIYSDFPDARSSLYAACQDKIGTYGITSANCDQVLNAWTAVGIGSLPTTPGPLKVYLPVIMKPVATCSPSGILNNGSFESGTASWVESSSDIISGGWSGTPDGGSWVAWLGGYNYANDILYQTINIPAGRTALQVTYYLYIGSQDSTTTPYDFLYTSLQPVSGITLPETWVWDNTGRGGWWKITLTWNELPYAGQSMRLYFHATTNGSLNTNFFVDTASVQVKCSRYTALTAMSDAPVTIQKEHVDGPPSPSRTDSLSK